MPEHPSDALDKWAMARDMAALEDPSTSVVVHPDGGIEFIDPTK